MVKTAKIQKGEIVLDPCAGIGALLALARAAGGRVSGGLAGSRVGGGGSNCSCERCDKQVFFGTRL